MYQLLPIVSAYSSVFSTLPVEMWCLILRLVDSKSLMAAMRSSTFFRHIVRGDVILKKTAEMARKEEQQQLMEQLTRPGMAASVTRDEHSKLFGTNRQKKVTIAKSRNLFKHVHDSKKKEAQGYKAATKTTKTARFTPYRI